MISKQDHMILPVFHWWALEVCYSFGCRHLLLVPGVKQVQQNVWPQLVLKLHSPRPRNECVWEPQKKHNTNGFYECTSIILCRSMYMNNCEYVVSSQKLSPASELLWSFETMPQTCLWCQHPSNVSALPDRNPTDKRSEWAKEGPKRRRWAESVCVCVFVWGKKTSKDLTCPFLPNSPLLNCIALGKRFLSYLICHRPPRD